MGGAATEGIRSESGSGWVEMLPGSCGVGSGLVSAEIYRGRRQKDRVSLFLLENRRRSLAQHTPLHDRETSGRGLACICMYVCVRACCVKSAGSGFGGPVRTVGFAQSSSASLGSRLASPVLLGNGVVRRLSVRLLFLALACSSSSLPLSRGAT